MITSQIAFNSKEQSDTQVLRAEACFAASGCPIRWARSARLDLATMSLSGRELLADRGGWREGILYWTRVGYTPPSWAQQRLTMAVQNLKGAVSDGALFRVSTIEGMDNSRSEAIKEFIAEVPRSFRESVIL
jgi:EpsI family protein